MKHTDREATDPKDLLFSRNPKISLADVRGWIERQKEDDSEAEKLEKSVTNLDKNHNLSFQYIVTTTEPPPEDFQIPPWRIEPVLDASTKDGRLFRDDL